MKINRMYKKSGKKFALIKIEHHVTRDMAVSILCSEYAQSMEGFPDLSESKASSLIREYLQNKGEEPLMWWTDGLEVEEVETVRQWAEKTVDRLWPAYLQER